MVNQRGLEGGAARGAYGEPRSKRAECSLVFAFLLDGLFCERGAAARGLGGSSARAYTHAHPFVQLLGVPFQRAHWLPAPALPLHCAQRCFHACHSALCMQRGWRRWGRVRSGWAPARRPASRPASRPILRLVIRKGCALRALLPCCCSDGREYQAGKCVSESPR